MLGLYDNFPENIHRIENFVTIIPQQKLQRKLIQTLQDINCKQFSFEEIGHPAIHDCRVILEMGIADSTSFNYVDAEETKKVLITLKKQAFRVMDFFNAIRYYKDEAQKKMALRFDYYMLRLVFSGNNSVEIQVFHERGPRHISPEDLAMFLLNKVNEASGRRVLKRIEPPQDGAN